MYEMGSDSIGYYLFLHFIANSDFNEMPKNNTKESFKSSEKRAKEQDEGQNEKKIIKR